jgi:hypothetical protein
LYTEDEVVEEEEELSFCRIAVSARDAFSDILELDG